MTLVHTVRPTDLFQQFYTKHQDAAGVNTSLNPPDVFAMRKVQSLNEVSLNKLKRYGVAEKLSQPVLVKKNGVQRLVRQA